MGKKNPKKTPDPFVPTGEEERESVIAPQAETLHNESRADHPDLADANPTHAAVDASIPAQVSQAWNGLLAMATAQGATRGDIIGMTLQTVESVLTMTAQAMWPEGQDLPKEELQAFGLFQGLAHGVTDARKGLGR